MDFEAKFDRRMPSLNPDSVMLDRLLQFHGVGAHSIKQLSGGYSTLNYRVEKSDGEVLVLRLSDKPLRQFEAEISCLKLLKGIIPAPLVYSSHPAGDKFPFHCAMLEYIPGKLLSEVESSLSLEAINTVAVHIGEILAAIHSNSFPSSGFLGQDCQVVEAFPDFYTGYFSYLEECLKHPRLHDRLSHTELHELEQLVSDFLPAMRELKPSDRLVHSDFNQKNLLVAEIAGKWQVTGVLDWEFAFVGSGLVDFGNFFRFEEEFSPNFKAPLLESYKTSGGYLPDNWRETAAYLDLLSMVQMLLREEESPKTFSTARGVIRKTLERYASRSQSNL